MIFTLYLIIASGLLALIYGYVVGKQVISSSPGNSKMQEIASAIQVGARAYLNRQYKTISIVGFIILGPIFGIIGLAGVIVIASVLQAGFLALSNKFLESDENEK